MKMLQQLLTSLHPATLLRYAIIGAAIGMAVISFFVLGVDHPNPEWPRYWMARPLIITPLAGALGGFFYGALESFRQQGGVIKIMAITVGLLVFLIVLWLGVVLGLDGTMWN
ncbi:hypothetical protein KJS94_06075 [Flavihumibacter rivuli]|uniref:hypothetical protein n=1 Tax=Flavihumibacter rivuli TaxID=2838156 RepID=UPI001BDEB12A|nr:hypothetical protein [Flavihumibacter rivuli]ULQ57764.1 hypothetical protein KJS94_06075 [Flavihumibacter rivuli]